MKQKLLLVLFFIGILTSNAQDPTRFQKEVDELCKAEYHFSPEKKMVVFTGSSSIRMWKDVADYFPEYNVVNNGFGGSHFSDLLFYYDNLITRQKPDVLFIYEGDNDIADGKKPSKVLKEAKLLVGKIQQDQHNTRVILISPKPSIARWNLKKDYIKLNRKLGRYCKKNDNLYFADVWNVMLDKNKMVYQDIFIQDGLHMNKKGYDLWSKVLSEYLE